MSIFDKVKGRLGFDEDDWEEEYDGTFDHENESTLVVHPRTERETWNEEYDDDYDEPEYYSPEDEQEEEEDEGAGYQRGNVRLTSRPGYAGYRPGDKVAFEGMEEDEPRNPKLPHSATSSTPRVSRGVVTGREVTTGLEQSRALKQSTMHISEPRSFADAEDIGTHFKAGQPVLLSMQYLTRDVARRILDFSFGLTYGRDGTIQKVSEKAFALVPKNAQISEIDKLRLAEMGLIEKPVAPEPAPSAPEPTGEPAMRHRFDTAPLKTEGARFDAARRATNPGNEGPYGRR